MPLSGRRSPGRRNSKGKTPLGACLAIPEAVGGWRRVRKHWIPRREVRQAMGRVMQGHQAMEIIQERGDEG